MLILIVLYPHKTTRRRETEIVCGKTNIRNINILLNNGIIILHSASKAPLMNSPKPTEKRNSMEITSNKLDKNEEIKTSQIIAEAFAEDPVMNAIFNDSNEIHHFMCYITKYLNIYGEIHHTVDFSGAALWVPPHSKFLTLGLIFKNKNLLFDFFRLIPKISIISLIRLINISDYLDKNHPAKDHYYLFAIGVLKEKRRNGIGGELLNFAFSKFGADTAYYLENSNIANISFYKQHGFTLVSTGEYRKAQIFFMTKNIP